MSEIRELLRWAELMDRRGIAGIGARETAEEKSIVERSIMDVFSTQLCEVLGGKTTRHLQQAPPLPDFAWCINELKLQVELTELIDPDLIKTAKHIRSTPSHPLHTEPLWFDTSESWLHKHLNRLIAAKNRTYEGRGTKIDILLIWNEAEQLGIEDTDLWLGAFPQFKSDNIKSVYFMSWAHPGYVGRPIWSMTPHSALGTVNPEKITTSD